jgi:predicted O-methyltransferase YrrM
MRAEEVDALQVLARLLPWNPTIINIGAGLGTSACAFLEARPDAFVVSIDKEACPEEAEALRACGLDASRCIRILGRSEDIGAHWPWPVDALFIDGGHEQGIPTADYAAWAWHVKPGGWVAFHDYGAAMLLGMQPEIDALAVPGPIVARVDTLIAYGVSWHESA